MRCVKCQSNLHSKYLNHSDRSSNYFCQSCHSQFVSFSFFKKLFDESFYLQFEYESKKKQIISQFKCPRCFEKMTLHLNVGICTQVESCSHCQSIWFDRGEIEQLKKNINDKTENKIKNLKWSQAREVYHEYLIDEDLNGHKIFRTGFFHRGYVTFGLFQIVYDFLGIGRRLEKYPFLNFIIHAGIFLIIAKFCYLLFRKKYFHF